jgi:uncharacterized membrane protein (DUF485 family)
MMKKQMSPISHRAHFSNMITNRNTFVLSLSPNMNLINHYIFIILIAVPPLWARCKSIADFDEMSIRFIVRG